MRPRAARKDGLRLGGRCLRDAGWVANARGDKAGVGPSVGSQDGTDWGDLGPDAACHEIVGGEQYPFSCDPIDQWLPESEDQFSKESEESR